MTHTIPVGIKTMQSIMQNRGNARIWLQDLAAYGWAAGKGYTVLIDGDAITITADPTSKRKVGKAKGGIIDLTNKRITAWAMAVQATHVDFTYYNDRIIISVARQHRELAPRVPTPREDVTPAPSVPVMPTHKPQGAVDIFDMIV